MKMICLTAALSLFCLLSCKDNAAESPKRDFDTALWKTKDITGNYPFRDEMLEDLVYRIKLKGFPKEKVTKMLGEPDWTNKDYLYYEVFIKKENRVFPFQKRYLVLKLAKDNTVEWRKIKD